MQDTLLNSTSFKRSKNYAEPEVSKPLTRKLTMGHDYKQIRPSLATYFHNIHINVISLSVIQVVIIQEVSLKHSASILCFPRLSYTFSSR
jgi:hypothetical protein